MSTSKIVAAKAKDKTANHFCLGKGKRRGRRSKNSAESNSGYAYAVSLQATPRQKAAVLTPAAPASARSRAKYVNAPAIKSKRAPGQITASNEAGTARKAIPAQAARDCSRPSRKANRATRRPFSKWMSRF